MGILDKLPFATIAALAGIAVTVVAYLSHDISFDKALLYLGAYQVGVAAVGEVRNRAGKGLRGDN